VPLRLELLLAEAEDVLPAADEVDDELDDEQAARASAATANPAVATCCLRRKCISGTPYGVYRVLGRDEQPGRPAHCGARVQFAGGAGTGGKMKGVLKGAKRLTSGVLGAAISSGGRAKNQVALRAPGY
jgi:hypothetical protein